MTGRRIAEERRNQGLTQAQLANKCGLTQPMIARYEGGYPVPPMNLKRIAEVLGLSIEVLRQRDENINTTGSIIQFDEHRFNQLLKDAKSYPLEEKVALYNLINMTSKLVKFKEMLSAAKGIGKGII